MTDLPSCVAINNDSGEEVYGRMQMDEMMATPVDLRHLHLKLARSSRDLLWYNTRTIIQMLSVKGCARDDDDLQVGKRRAPGDAGVRGFLLDKSCRAVHD